MTKKEYSSGTFTSGKPINLTETDKIHSKCDCIDGSNVNGIRQPVLYSFALDEPPGHKIFRKPSNKHYILINLIIVRQKFIWRMIKKTVNLNRETITFTLQLMKESINSGALSLTLISVQRFL